MRVRTAVLSTLALVPVLASTGCSSVWNCNPPEEDFSIDEPVTAKEVDALIEAGYSNQTRWETVECQTVCQRKYAAVRGWNASGVRTCELSLPENEDGTGKAGRVTCSGIGVEYFCEGRRPLGYAEIDDELSDDPLGSSLAAMAHLEAASVLAFEELAAWLDAHQAPASLVQRCRAAADDERHHTRWLTRLAQERGVAVPVPTATGGRDASPLEVAIHNAVEGCVHESFAALMAAVRAQRAADPRLRGVFAKITADEIRHGQLAWDLHAWLRGLLTEGETRAVDAAQRRALDALPGRARAQSSAPLAELGGLDGRHAERVADHYARRLVA